jgi:hypothetical protein
MKLREARGARLTFKSMVKSPRVVWIRTDMSNNVEESQKRSKNQKKGKRLGG